MTTVAQYSTLQLVPFASMELVSELQEFTHQTPLIQSGSLCEDPQLQHSFPPNTQMKKRVHM